MKKIFKELKTLKYTNFIFLTLAGIINATGVTLFLIPLNLVDGGFSGTAYLIDKLTPPFFTLSLALIVINFPLFIFGVKKIGFKFLIYSLYTIAIYSLFSYIFQHLLNIDFSQGSPITKNDILLSAVFGGLISGVGSGLTIRFGGALDGIEVLAVIFAKKLNLTVGTFVMLYNLILYIVVGLIFQAWIIPLYSILAYMVGLKAVDFIVEGLDKAKSAMIITNKETEVLEKISKVFGRGITVFDAHGYYSKQEKTVIYIVINRFQISRLKSIVKDIDNSAFVAITDISEITGGNKNVNNHSIENGMKSDISEDNK